MLHAFRTWEIASGAFFAYVGLVALVGPARAAAGRGRALGFVVAGLALTLTSSALPRAAIIHPWLVPPALLLLGYWASGCLFVAPMPLAERVLVGVDRVFRVGAFAASVPRAVAEFLEVSYAAIYALIPIALAIHLTLGHAPNPDRFWTVILLTDYVCFAALPWLQTRPPRTLEATEPWRSRVRALNRRVVDSASIHVNTCPSGHAAEALAAALLVMDAPAPVVFWMLFCALAVSAGAVFGRYHYGVDVFAGWLVAVVVWALV